jgi:hypothetical protein
MPRIGGGAPHAPEGHVEPTSPEPVHSPREPQGTYEAVPGRAAQTWTVRSQAGMVGGRVQVERGGPPTEWRESYALPRCPDEYASTSEPGVYRDMHTGQAFVFHIRRPYAVVRDTHTGSWLLTTPGNPLERGSALRRNAVGEWILQKDPSQASVVGSAWDAWSDILARGGQAVARVPEQRLTQGESAFIDRWRNLLSPNQFAELMHVRRDHVDAYLRSAGQQGEAMPRPSSLAEQSPAGVAGPSVVARGPNAPSASSRSNLIDDFARPGWKSMDMLARKHHVPLMLVDRLRADYMRMREDWDRTRCNDIAQTGSLTDEARSFIQQWRTSASGSVLSSIMGVPEAAIDGFMQTDEHRRAGPSAVASPASTLPQAATAAVRSQGRAEPAPSDEVAEHLLRNPGGGLDGLASRFGVTDEQVNSIASDVRSAVQAWHELAQAGVQVRPSVIVGPLTEREKHFVRTWQSTLPTSILAGIMQKPKDVIDAFVARYGSTATAPVPDTFAPDDERADRAREEWQHVADADVAGGERPSRMEFAETAREFVDRWRGILSDRNLAILMALSNDVLDHYVQRLRSSERDARAVEASPAAHDSGPSAQPGSSGHQEPLTSDQLTRILELNAQRMSPSTIAAYVGKPREMIEAYLRSATGGSRRAS